MEEIENLLPLSDHDREVLPEADVQRWRKHVDFVVRAFREEDGYLKRPFETEWGVWAFTEAGRERADALMEKLTESGLEDDRS